MPLILALAAAPFAVGDAHDSDAEPASMTAPGHTSGWSMVANGQTGDARLVAIVHEITAWQIEARGESAAATNAPLARNAASAAQSLADLHDAELPVDTVLAMSGLVPELDAALTRVLVDFVVYETETRAAFHGVDVAALRQNPDRADEPRLAGVMLAQEALLSSMLDLRTALDTAAARPLVAFAVPDVFHIDLRSDCADNVYTENMPLIVDECGNDVYQNNAGGGGVLGDGVLEPYPPAAALADFDGDDTYVGDKINAVNGGAFAGAGFLFDGAGSDRYDMPDANDGVNGGGSIGSGFLVDDGPQTDVYAAGGWGTNGGGYIGGRGLLVDMGGDETYAGTHDAVNGGGALGNGALWDDRGDDTYHAGVNGVNGGGLASSGLLYDRMGHDAYSDNAGGTGTDVTVVPKEINGAQIDDA